MILDAVCAFACINTIFLLTIESLLMLDHTYLAVSGNKLIEFK